MTNIIFEITDAGSGHRSVAQAIIENTGGKTSDKLTCEIVDFYKAVDVFGLRHLPAVYKIATEHFTFAYNAFYNLTNHIVVIKFLSTALYKLIKKHVYYHIKKHTPDTVIIANPCLIGHLFAYAKEEFHLEFRLIVLITDPITIHKSWIVPSADIFIVTTESAFDFVSAYASPNIIKLIEYPVHINFCDHRIGLASFRKYSSFVIYNSAMC